MYTDHTVFNQFVQNVFDIVFEEILYIYSFFVINVVSSDLIPI